MDELCDYDEGWTAIYTHAPDVLSLLFGHVIILHACILARA